MPLEAPVTTAVPALMGGSLPAQGVQPVEGRRAVPRHEQLRGIHVPNHAGPIDDVADPARQQAQRFLYAVALAHGAAAVREQQERQIIPRGEATMRADGIGAHADHLGALGGELLVAVAERARFERTPRRLVLRIEIERSEEHTSELQSLAYLVCRLLLEKKKKKQ